MMKPIKLFLLVLFVSNSMPRAQALIYYPALDSVLQRIDKENPEIASYVRSNSLPSSMCGVKASVKKEPISLSVIGNSSLFGVTVLKPILYFVLAPRLASQKISLTILNVDSLFSKLILLPPPRPLI